MAITLEEVAYQINGSLDMVRITLEGKPDLYSLRLLDNCKKICPVSIHPVVNQNAAVGVGNTEQEARDNLAKVLQGKTIEHSYPFMWERSYHHLLIPTTLVGKTDK